MKTFWTFSGLSTQQAFNVQLQMLIVIITVVGYTLAPPLEGESRCVNLTIFDASVCTFYLRFLKRTTNYIVKLVCILNSSGVFSVVQNKTKDTVFRRIAVFPGKSFTLGVNFQQRIIIKKVI